MEDVENYSEQIAELMKIYEDAVLDKDLYQSNRIKWKQSCSEKQKKLKNLILSMKQEIEELSSASAKSYQSLLKQHQTKLTALVQEYQTRLKVPVKMQAMRKSIPKLETDHEEDFNSNRTIDSYMERGDKEMARMEQAVQNMNVEIEEGIAMAEAINLELNRQIEQLDKIQDTVKDTGATLNRAKRIIMFFEKAAQCDKCMLGLVLMNLLALIAFIVLITKRR